MVTDENRVSIQLPHGYAEKPSWRQYRIVVLPRAVRDFFPGYKEHFQLDTDVGPLEVWVSSANSGTPIRDAHAGSYIVGVPKCDKITNFASLADWYARHSELEPGNTIVFTRLGNVHYRLDVRS